MENKYFIEKSCIIASIMCTKYERLGQNYVTFNELNYIQKELNKEFENRSLNICIIDKIDDNYFNIQDEIILLNDFTLQDIKQKYYYSSDKFSNDILDIVWNHNFIIKSILKMKKKELESLKKHNSGSFNQKIYNTKMNFVNINQKIKV